MQDLKILIIGGNAAGLAAASRAKRIDPRLNVTVLEKGPYISYSTCGIPYYLAKMVSAADLIAYTPESFEKERGIKVRNYTRVDQISPSRKRVTATRADTGERAEFSYERLLIATGVRPKVPSIPGTDLKNVFTIIDLQDALHFNEALQNSIRVAIIGAGYVGLEMAECLQALGKTVHLYERAPHVLPGMDADMAQIIEYELQRFGIRLSLNANVLALAGSEGHVTGVKAASGLGIDPAEVVLLDTGVVPNVDLAREAGIRDFGECLHGNERAGHLCSRQLCRNVLRHSQAARPALHRNRRRKARAGRRRQYGRASYEVLWRDRHDCFEGL